MKITKSCFAVLGFGYLPPWIVNAGFIVGKEKTLIIDAGPSYMAAQTIYGYANNVKPGNEIIVVNTEKHLDHIAGNCFFKEKGIDIYGYAGINRSKDELKNDINEWNNSILNPYRRGLHEESIFFENTEIINPNKLLNEGDFFDLGGVIVEIISTRGHTSTNVSILVEKEKILYTGDCIVSKYVPNLESGNVEDWKIWLNSLDKISEMDLQYVVPGHGHVLSDLEIEKEISRIKNILDSAIELGKAPTIV